MKKYLKNKEGMALPMVLVIMTILMILASGMAIYAFNSLRAVRYMSNEKKAYYLSRAGVESAAYAYQQAVGAIGGSQNNTAEPVVEQIKTGETPVTSQRVYLVDARDPINDKTPWKNLKFQQTQPSDAGSVIGYFDVTLGWGVDSMIYTEEKVDTGQGAVHETIKKEKAEPVVVVRSTAVCGFGDETQTSTQAAFVIDPTTVEYGEDLYDNKGVAVHGKDATGVYNKRTQIIHYDQLKPGEAGGGFLGFIKRLLRGVMGAIIEAIWPEVKTGKAVDFYYKTATGSLVLKKPENSKNLSFDPAVDNFYAYSATGDLFLENMGINACPGRRLNKKSFNQKQGNFVSVGLYGDEIIVDGDITMYAYVVNPDLIGGTQGQMNDVFMSKKFYLGTVLIGDANLTPPKRYDTKSPSDGGVSVDGKAVPVNKIYFNGGVYLKVKTRWGGEETYKVFKSGDIAYFNGQYLEKDMVGSEDISARGIDLVKYFVDAVLNDAEGYHYGQSVKDRMWQIKRMYYGFDNEKPEQYKDYFEEGNVMMRKLQVSYKGGTATVDGKTENVAQLVPPSPMDEAALIWGNPKYGSIFDGKTTDVKKALADAQAKIDASKAIK